MSFEFFSTRVPTRAPLDSPKAPSLASPKAPSSFSDKTAKSKDTESSSGGTPRTAKSKDTEISEIALPKLTEPKGEAKPSSSWSFVKIIFDPITSFLNFLFEKLFGKPKPTNATPTEQALPEQALSKDKKSELISEAVDSTLDILNISDKDKDSFSKELTIFFKAPKELNEQELKDFLTFKVSELQKKFEKLVKDLKDKKDPLIRRLDRSPLLLKQLEQQKIEEGFAQLLAQGTILQGLQSNNFELSTAVSALMKNLISLNRTENQSPFLGHVIKLLPLTIGNSELTNHLLHITEKLINPASSLPDNDEFYIYDHSYSDYSDSNKEEDRVSAVLNPVDDLIKFLKVTFPDQSIDELSADYKSHLSKYLTPKLEEKQKELDALKEADILSSNAKSFGENFETILNLLKDVKELHAFAKKHGSNQIDDFYASMLSRFLGTLLAGIREQFSEVPEGIKGKNKIESLIKELLAVKAFTEKDECQGIIKEDTLKDLDQLQKSIEKHLAFLDLNTEATLDKLKSDFTALQREKRRTLFEKSKQELFQRLDALLQRYEELKATLDQNKDKVPTDFSESFDASLEQVQDYHSSYQF